MSRLTTLGELTSSIAHEVSQPLGGMITSAGACARWLAAEPPDIAEARAALDNIAADGKRAREVIARIRALTKRQMVRKDSLDINHELLEVLALTEHESRSHGIVRRTELDRTLPRVPGDRIQLQQVLLNLIVNAIEAMSAVGDRPRLLTIVSRHDSPNVVLVEVRDTGSGLDPQHIEQVFEAFYTTKAGRHRHRLVDQPLHRRGPRRAAVGEPERASRRRLPAHAAGRARRDTMSDGLRVSWTRAGLR